MNLRGAISIFFASFVILTLFYRQLPTYLSKQDSINPETIQIEEDKDSTSAIYNNKKIPIPSTNFTVNSKVLGDDTTKQSSSKRIEIDLTAQRLYAFENDQMLYNFLISSGKWDRTPTGTFYIWSKVRSQKMSGGSKELGTYYYLPKVPYIMFFYNDKFSKAMGFSLHGTYWHNNFGQPMSHGCINMKTSEVAQLYDWIKDDEISKVPIIIYGKYQNKISKK